MNYNEIPKATRSPAYKVSVGWNFFSSWLKEMDRDYILELSPDYQRDHVWTLGQEKGYIEHVLRGGRSGLEIYFNCKDLNYMDKNERPILELVDGKQRIKALLGFFEGRVKPFGVSFAEFEGKMPRDYYFVIYINDLPTRADVMGWYVEMNAGGTVHSEEEISRVKALIAEVRGN